MSFSSDVKASLTQVEEQHRECGEFELEALLRICGSVSFAQGLKLFLRTENRTVANRMMFLLEEYYAIEAQALTGEARRSAKQSAYTILLEGEEAEALLRKAGVLRKNQDSFSVVEFNWTKIKRNCCRGAFLRGCFLACGSLSDPKKTYHLEFVLQNLELAEAICRLMEILGLKCRVSSRKQTYVVYCKDGESIADFLALTGAHDAILELENIRVLKDVRNNVNRMVNCETANIQKTLDASYRQIENIEYLLKNAGYESLPSKLQMAAEARLNNPDMTLSELAQNMSPPISRSAMNHRLRRLDELAQELRGKRGEIGC
ncbi:MAG: DNA-binding protein WhiA [Christensenellales bacterium]